MSLYSCDYEGSWMYRERLEISDGNIKCCESGIVIPKGQPYAHCQPAWSYDVDFEELSEEEMEKFFYDSSMPQCIEVWRLLRRNNRLHGACSPFGEAINEYAEAIDEAWPYDKRGTHALRYRELLSTIKRARERYEAGGGPRLHPKEKAALESGEWQDPIPFTMRAKKAAA